MGPALPDPRTLDDAFSYTCNACGRCCHGKNIQVNPFEVAALGRYLGLTSAAVRERYLDPSRTYLARRTDGYCTFFADGGCGVHPARPLVCRLYPLGISRDAEGNLAVMSHPPHPRTEGVYGRDGTVADWVRNQAAATHLQAAEAYHALYVEMLVAARAGNDTALDVDSLMDLDASVGAYAAAQGIPEPEDPTARYVMHIEAIRHACGLAVDDAR